MLYPYPVQGATGIEFTNHSSEQDFIHCYTLSGTSLPSIDDPENLLSMRAVQENLGMISTKLPKNGSVELYCPNDPMAPKRQLRMLSVWTQLTATQTPASKKGVSRAIEHFQARSLAVPKQTTD